MSYELSPELRAALASARSVGVITGAGVSAESGIGTYRGKGGVYDDPEEGERTIEAVSGPTLRSDPDRTWRAIAKIAGASVGAEPNPAHDAIARIQRGVERFALLTQNVDGLHQRAGSTDVIDIHGTVFTTICMSCGDEAPLEQDIAAITAAPRCGGCEGVLRPDVVLFGEMLPPDKVVAMQRAFYHHVPDVVIIAGTSGMFPYIAEPVLIAREAGKVTIEVNTEPTQLTPVVGHALQDRAGVVLPAIADALLSGAN